jgi:hypothetical protein
MTLWCVENPFSCKHTDFQKNEKSSITLAIPNKGFGAYRLRRAPRLPAKSLIYSRLFKLFFRALMRKLALWIDFLRSNQKFGYLRAENFVLLNPLLGIAVTLYAIASQQFNSEY